MYDFALAGGPYVPSPIVRAMVSTRLRGPVPVSLVLSMIQHFFPVKNSSPGWPGCGYLVFENGVYLVAHPT